MVHPLRNCCCSRLRCSRFQRHNRYLGRRAVQQGTLSGRRDRYWRNRTAARAAVPALIEAVRSRRRFDRDPAVQALGRIGPDARAAVPILANALDPDGDISTCCYAAEALSRIGPSAIPAVRGSRQSCETGRRLRRCVWRGRCCQQTRSRLARKEAMETAYLDIRLGIIPAIPLRPHLPLTDKRGKEIRSLVNDLAHTRAPALGVSATASGRSFAPLLGQTQLLMFRSTNDTLKSTASMRALVEVGPDAIPFLLEGLSNHTDTRLTFDLASGFGAMWFDTEVAGNPLNPLERRTIRKPWPPDEHAIERTSSYTVKVGDMCFVALGQITGRSYSAVRYQPSNNTVINSPVRSKELRDRVGAVWSSADPAKRLLDSLLLDYSTQGIFSGRSLDGWDQGSTFQIQAAIRLLYYFPDERPI